jgi:putative ABC transport system permease protein
MARDIKYALRALINAPVFSAIAILTLALGIGANTAVFSVVEGTLLRPLPFPHAERLVRLYEAEQENGPRDATLPLSEQTSRQWRQFGGDTFEDIGAAAGTRLTVGSRGSEPPRNIQATRISENFFSVLGIQPAHGRNFTVEENRDGGPEAAIVSDDFWRNYLGGRADVLGMGIILEGVPHTIVGVMPRSFRHPYRSQVWVPARFATAPTNGPVAHYLYAAARLRPGVTVAQAEAAARRMCIAINQAEPNPNNAHGVYMLPLRESFVMDLRPKVLVIVAAALCALLIAAANFGGLLLARVIDREGEFALRAALGASRLLIVRQQLIQALLLAAIGTFAGILISFWSTPALFALSPEGSDATGSAMREFDYAVRLDWPVFSFAAGVMFFVGLGFGFFPALRASRTDLRGAMNVMARGATLDRSARRWLSSLVIVELAIAAALLMASITAAQYFRKLVEEPWGFETDGRLQIGVALSEQLFQTGNSKQKVLDAQLAELRALPGVTSATVTCPSPMNAPRDLIGFNADGAPPAPEPRGFYISYVRAAAPGYFKTMGQRLIRGREFLETDTANSPFVCLVSESFAQRFWPNQDPIGHRVKWMRLDDPRPWMTVVGVIGDMKAIANPREGEVIGMVARPLAQMADLGSVYLDDITFVVRSERHNVSEAAIRAAFARADSRIAPATFESLEEVASRSRTTERFISVLVSLFGFLGLVLAAIGVYGLLALQVARRQREFGIRSALGATGRQLVELVARQGVKLFASGAAVGGLATFAVVRLLRNQWTQMPAPNFIAWIGGIAVLSTAVILACWLPARRASRVNPVIALRTE